MQQLHQRLKTDPAFFSREIFGEDPYDKQVEIMEAVRDNPRVTVRSANGVGKDWTASTIALWYLYTHYPSIVITTAPTNRQVELVLWGEIRRKWANAKFPLGGDCLTTQIKLDPHWYAVGFATDDESQFQGFHEQNVLIIFSEAQGISGTIYNAAKGCLTGNSKWLLIGNPLSPVGDFYQTFSDPTWKKIHISAFDSPNVRTQSNKYPAIVTQQWIDDRRNEWGEDSPLYQSRVLGQFPTESEDTLISLTNIEQAKDRKVSVAGNRILGVDVARYGSCESVVCDFDGYTAKFPLMKMGLSVTELAGEIINYMKDEQAKKDFDRSEPFKIFCDDVGVGGGLTDILEDQGYNVTGLIANAKANETEKFVDLRMEAYWILAEKFRTGQISIPADEKLVSQLAGLTYEHTMRGQKRLASKEKLRKAGMESPDRADALALACWGWKSEGRSGRTGTLMLNTKKMMAGGAGGW